MKHSEHYIEDDNLSFAWIRAMRLVTANRGGSEVAPLIVSVTGFDDGIVRENGAIRKALDGTLLALGKQQCATVAGTIFPKSLWNPRQPRAQLFQRYEAILPKLRAGWRKNTRGLYFERLTRGGPKGAENQLQFVLSQATSRRGVRRSALQLAVFDPARDHTPSAQLGFPCLQHVTFAPTKRGLIVNAFYATQYLVERAYGNYLGICHLGQFAAHELGVPLTRMTCFTGIAIRDVSIKHVKKVLDVGESELRSADHKDNATIGEEE